MYSILKHIIIICATYSEKYKVIISKNSAVAIRKF